MTARIGNAPRCHIPWQQIVVDSTGAAVPCCYWGAYDNNNLPLGNVKTQTIGQIWNGEGFQKLRAGMASGDLKAAGCEKCYALKQGQALALDYDRSADGDLESDYGRNIATLKAEIAAGATVLAAKPTIVSYTPSHRCNIRCTHCYQEAARNAEIDRKDADAEVAGLAPYLVRLIAGGGEPFLLPIWRSFLADFDLSKNPYFDFATTTNGTLISDQVLAGLSRFRNLTINVSFDGTGEVFETVRKGAKFEQVLGNLRKLRDVVKRAPGNQVIGTSMCVMKSNIRDLPNYIRLMAQERLLFSLSPVVTLPPSENLRCFNRLPKDEMTGWREALVEARVAMEEFFPVLAEIWRCDVPEPTKQVWRHSVDLIEGLIPFDLADVQHRPVCVSLPADFIEHQKMLLKKPLTAFFFRAEKPADLAAHWADISGNRCEVWLAPGRYVVNVGTQFVPAGYEDMLLLDVPASDAVELRARYKRGYLGKLKHTLIDVYLRAAIRHFARRMR